jgi:pyruvate dehydrogenase E2 component (dihydrolipoamide acetyltransferase)
MSDTATPVAAPAAAAPVAQPAVVAPPAPAATSPVPSVQNDPPYLADRLERDRKSVLKQLGIKIEKGIPAQTQIDNAAKKLEDTKQSRKDERKAKEKAEAKVVELEARVSAIKTFADITLAGLTTEQQAQVKAAAGDDPAEQLKIVALLQPSFAKAPAAPPAATPPAVDAKPPIPTQAPAPAPAGTAPPAGPAPTMAGSELPLVERYKQVLAIAPTQAPDGSFHYSKMAAAKVQFLLEHGDALIDNLFK